MNAVKFTFGDFTHRLHRVPDSEYRARRMIQDIYPSLAGTGYLLLQNGLPPQYPIVPPAKLKVHLTTPGPACRCVSVLQEQDRTVLEL
jgi:hypothetical protein